MLELFRAGKNTCLHLSIILTEKWTEKKDTTESKVVDNRQREREREIEIKETARDGPSACGIGEGITTPHRNKPACYEML